MSRANDDIRAAAKEAGVCLWEIGKYGFDLSDTGFHRRMRDEFSTEDKAKAFQAIQDIKASKEAVA